MTTPARRLFTAAGLAVLGIAAPAAASDHGDALRLAQAASPPTVGQEPEPEPEPPPQVTALAEQGGVLTKAGQLVVEPSVQYTNSQVNRFTFTGVEILDSFLIGMVDAEDIDRNVTTAALDLRLGLTNRLEIGVKVPYVYREETRSITIPQAPGGEEDVPFEQNLEGEGLGDVEASLHWQINRGDHNGPWFIGNLRYKSTTGDGPFNVEHNDAGIEQEAATGSGFESVEPSITVLYRSDPAVLYGNLGYLFNLEDEVGRTLGAGENAVQVGDVDPGDALRVSFGTSVSLNPRTSISLGYKHDFIQETDTELNGVDFRSSSLDVGSLLVGISQVMGPRSSASVNLEVGATADAPDVTVTLRLPFILGPP